MSSSLSVGVMAGGAEPEPSGEPGVQTASLPPGGGGPRGQNRGRVRGGAATEEQSGRGSGLSSWPGFSLSESSEWASALSLSGAARDAPAQQSVKTVSQECQAKCSGQHSGWEDRNRGTALRPGKRSAGSGGSLSSENCSVASRREGAGRAAEHQLDLVSSGVNRAPGPH